LHNRGSNSCKFNDEGNVNVNVNVNVYVKVRIGFEAILLIPKKKLFFSAVLKK